MDSNAERSVEIFTGVEIAVIGMAGRFPGARNTSEFWRNLRDGVESVTFFSDAALLAAGESAEVLRDPAYVKAQPVLTDMDCFDAGFFGFSPQDAAIMDPQHRIFLEVGWEALEDAGHDSEAFPGHIGVFAACGMNTYMMYHLVTNRRLMDTVGEWLLRHTGNDMNFLATRLSYVMNLQGPSLNVQTACSSTLVAIHLASQSLLNGECDMALAGGSTIVLPQHQGYLYKQGEILSPDGHCRPFDAHAKGTLFGSGSGVVVLRRLADAQNDGDRILAVIRGSAINNDGSQKVGYLAPSVEGQAKAITEALAVSGIDPETISYIEAHGTGTIVGDPIEVAALTQAYRRFTQKTGFCAIGSLKSNIGHLGEAAGVAGFIKTTLALQHQQIPPSLHYGTPNPQIDFTSSPFYVNTTLTPWQRSGAPRRAGITALGAGGTNCHVILEEAPEALPSSPSRPWQLLLLSAKTPTALDTATQNLAVHLKEQADLPLADVAYTLMVGRRAFAHRRILVCRTRDEAIAALAAQTGLLTSSAESTQHPVVFLFPGQGAQYPHMGEELYEQEPTFRQQVDACARLLQPHLGRDIREVLYPQESSEVARQMLHQTALAQPALFVVEYAMARLWMSWGITPAAMIGHSIGEYVAACLAGVFSLADALALVVDRGRLMQQMPAGAMLAVPLSVQDATLLLERSRHGGQISLAAVNAPALSVLAGPQEAIAGLEAELRERGVECHRLHTSHAFHSAMMEPALGPFGERCQHVRLQPPTMPYVSNLTGSWMTAEDATNPSYWVRHLRHTVRFADGLATILQDPNHILLEVGPGRTLTGLVRQQPALPVLALNSLRHAEEQISEQAHLLTACGKLWLSGARLDWSGFYAHESRHRVSLPTYPFARQRHWVEAPKPSASEEQRETDLHKKTDIAEWFSLPTWKQTPPLPLRLGAQHGEAGGWLAFCDETGLGARLIERLREAASSGAATAPVRLEIGRIGDLDSLQLQPLERRAPGPDEVEIQVRAAALNFADVLKATGLFPDAPFGMECAGVVVRVGQCVRAFQPGDAVVAIGPGSFCSHVVRQVRFVAPKPTALSFEEATTLPAAFMTAHYALHTVGNLRAGEKVLIHTASGGVGLAAVQVAQRLGAEIFATAGSPEKRAFLEALGLLHVFNSRTLDFADEIQQRTDGRGVDVVLNALTGDFIPRSLATLAAGGRFLEIGKAEIYTPEHLAALQLRDGVSYTPIDLTRLLRDQPDLYGALLRDVVAQVQQGHYVPLPRHVFPFSAALQAFSLMARTAHIGKVVLALDDRPIPTVYCVRAGQEFRQLGEHEYVINPARGADYATLFDALGDAAALSRIVHLWNVTTDASFEQQLDLGFFSLLHIAKAIGRQDSTRPIALSVLSTGLHQVAGETSLQPTKALLLGPCRVMPRELPHVTCRSIDVSLPPAGSWQRERLVEQLLAEVASDATELVIAYRAGERWTQSYQSVKLDAASGSAGLRQQGVYLITGGLGGLGLELAAWLAETVQAKLVLVSRSPLPTKTAWSQWLAQHAEHDPTSEKIRRLQACEAHGGEVLTIAADVTDCAQMQAVLQEVRKRFGALHGVVHAAGTLDDTLMQLKEPDSALGVIAPKVQGALLLDELLAGEQLDFFILCSSVSSVLGLQGQVDYTAANAFLDAFARHRAQRCSGPTVAINWGPWQEVGLAARAAQARRLAAPAPSASAERPQHPWLDRVLRTPDHLTFSTAFSRATHWLLAEHVIRGADALIPGTGFLELARAALEETPQAQPIEISNVVFEAPFLLQPSETRTLDLTLRRDGSAWAFRMHSGGAVTHVTGRIAYSHVAPPGRVDAGAATRRCQEREVILDGFLPQDFMDFGPRWGNVRRIHYGSGEALLCLELPAAYVAELEQFRLHPALLDMATGGAQALLPGFDHSSDFYVPFSYGCLCLWRSLPARLFSLVRLKDGSGQGVALFDVTLCDEQGEVVATVTDFMMRRVADRTQLGNQPSVRPSTATALADQVLREGILPREGVEALQRLLAAAPGPQIIVSSLDIQAWLQRVDAMARPASPQKPAERQPAAPQPRYAVQVVAGDDSVQRGLAEMWSEILGVMPVGPHEDFFALGGHSLLAVRLLTRIEKVFQKALPLAALFQAPTIAQLAALLHEDTAEKPRTFSSLVPLASDGDGPVLYCVHSVGGEAMSFRHLAGLLGPEQRVYGIQVPPGKRTAEFASSVEAIASYYVQELTAFQPQGPYFLGGWSAGSTLALEMAQQLEASGQHVALVVALDGAPFNIGAGTSLWNPLYYWKLLCNFPRWVVDDLMVDFSMQSAVSRVRAKLRSLGTTAGAVRRQTVPFPQVEGFMNTADFSKDYVAFMNAVYAALHRYIPKAYAGRVLLYQAKTQPLYHMLEVDRAWGRIARHLEVVKVRGTHVSLVREPHVRPIAAHLRHVLSTLRAETDKP